MEDRVPTTIAEVFELRMRSCYTIKRAMYESLAISQMTEDLAVKFLITVNYARARMAMRKIQPLSEQNKWYTADRQNHAVWKEVRKELVKREDFSHKPYYQWTHLDWSFIPSRLHAISTQVRRRIKLKIDVVEVKDSDDEDTTDEDVPKERFHEINELLSI